MNEARLEGYCNACGCREPSSEDLFSRTQAAMASNSKVVALFYSPNQGTGSCEILTVYCCKE